MNDVLAELEAYFHKRNRPPPSRAAIVWCQICRVVLGLLFVALTLAAIGVLSFQWMEWRQSGQWPQIPLRQALEYGGHALPSMGWPKVQAALDEILDWPAAMYGVLGALLSAYGAYRVNSKLDELIQRRRRG